MLTDSDRSIISERVCSIDVTGTATINGGTNIINVYGGGIVNINGGHNYVTHHQQALLSKPKIYRTFVA